MRPRALLAISKFIILCLAPRVPWLTALSLALFLGLGITRVSNATPIYLGPESLFPSGSLQRTWLEANTKRVQFQRWFKVATSDGTVGWIAEDHTLTPLQLADIAIVRDASPGRTRPELDAFTDQAMIEKGTEVLILEIKGSWARVYPLPLRERNETWVQTSNLNAKMNSATQKAFALKSVPIRVMPGTNSRAISQLRAGSFVHLVSSKPGWLEITRGVEHGFIRSDEASTLADLQSEEVRPIRSLTPLRRAPLPFADVVRTVNTSTRLKLLSNETLRWGEVKAPEIGPAWWPMGDSLSERAAIELKKQSLPNPPTAELKIRTHDLMARKVFALASSRAVPNLRFASARGIFRSINGEDWTLLKGFNLANYPIAIANGGAVFIGPYVSEDHGETFSQWIKWDNLVARFGNSRHFHLADLQTKDLAEPSSVRILKIQPLDAAGRQVILKLGVGRRKMSFRTDDQGANWRPYANH